MYSVKISSVPTDIFGPIAGPIVTDDFSLDAVKGQECLGSVSRNVCDSLLQKVRNKPDDPDYFCICLCCYNENLKELSKTIKSLMLNIEFMKKRIRFHDDPEGKLLQARFMRMKPVFVIIFDGVAAMDVSCREWVDGNFENATKVFEDAQAEASSSTELGLSDGRNVEVRVSLGSWWYFIEDNLFASDVDDENGSAYREECFLDFYVATIVKRSNHRKHNSHQWFFSSICAGLGTAASYVLLTDCGTSFTPSCLAYLAYDLHFSKDLIGVTGRMRAELPNEHFHPCEEAYFSAFRGNHEISGPQPCWKCYLTYFCSPAPLQGFECEAAPVFSSMSAFSLVEVMPVMPGPCQLMDWQAMSKYKILDEYFNLLFTAEPSSDDRKNSLRSLPSTYKPGTRRRISEELQVLLRESALIVEDTTNTSTSQDGALEGRNSLPSPATPLIRQTMRSGMGSAPGMVEIVTPRRTTTLATSRSHSTARHGGWMLGTAPGVEEGLFCGPVATSRDPRSSHKRSPAHTQIFTPNMQNQQSQPQSHTQRARRFSSGSRSPFNEESKNHVNGQKHLQTLHLRASEDTILDQLGSRSKTSARRTPRGIGRSLDNAFTPVSSRSSPFPDVMRDIGNRDAHASLPRSWPSQEAPNAVSQRPARQSDPHISQVAGKYSGTPLADPLVRSGGQAIAWIQRYFDFPHPSENTPVGRSVEGTTETPKISEHSPGYPQGCQSASSRSEHFGVPVSQSIGSFDGSEIDRSRSEYSPRASKSTPFSNANTPLSVFRSDLRSRRDHTHRTGFSASIDFVDGLSGVEEGSEIVGISSDDIDDVDAEASEANRNTNCPARNVDDTAREPVVVHRDKLTLAEFMRVNMRLAEDRVLSFVSVFASGMGTKWVTGASFSYQPECRFQSLLTQRRRWINGTLASFAFFFASGRAVSRVNGGLFDTHKVGKNMRAVNVLWLMMIIQYVFVLMLAPAVFMFLSADGLKELAKNNPETLGWTIQDAAGFAFVDFWLIVVLVIYIGWMFLSFYTPRGQIPETLCCAMAVVGIAFVIPVYLSLFTTLQHGLVFTHYVIFGSLVAPAFLSAILEGFEAAAMYICYMPWFFALTFFFLVYVPTYSIARLFDTTWGNRSTGRDHAINQEREVKMKLITFYFMMFVMISNIILTCVFYTSSNQETVLLCVAYVMMPPIFIQMVTAIYFRLIVVPMRPMFIKREDNDGGGRPDIKGIDSVGSAWEKVVTQSENHQIEAIGAPSAAVMQSPEEVTPSTLTPPSASWASPSQNELIHTPPLGSAQVTIPLKISSVDLSMLNKRSSTVAAAPPPVTEYSLKKASQSSRAGERAASRAGERAASAVSADRRNKPRKGREHVYADPRGNDLKELHVPPSGLPALDTVHCLDTGSGLDGLVDSPFSSIHSNLPGLMALQETAWKRVAE